MYPAPLIYDAERKMVACVLIQAAGGGSAQLAMLIDPVHWLVNVTPGMKKYMVKDQKMMEDIIMVTTGIDEEEQYRAGYRAEMEEEDRQAAANG